MKLLLASLLFVLVTVAVSPAQNIGGVTRIEANAAEGFYFPYYLYVPSKLRSVKNKSHTLLVIPNNTGKADDALEVHEKSLDLDLTDFRPITDTLDSALLMPVFPRPATDAQIYTHALDRDTLLTEKPSLKRLDRQLLAMIDDARRRLKKDGLEFEKKFFITGFSASGMFANRFAFLHPERIRAAAIGSPGGWPIAPVADFGGKMLRYPTGTSDLKTVAGKKLNLKALQKVPFFFFLGDQDTNDSVVFRDGYEKEDETLIFELFGRTPVERWSKSETLYKQNRLRAEFKLYKGVGHTINAQMFEEILDFFKTYSQF